MSARGGPLGRGLSWPTGLVVACRAEVSKLRHSLVPALTAGGICLAPLMGGVFLLAQRAPGGSAAVRDKMAALGGTPDWPGYLGLLTTIYAAGGLVVLGILTAWLFGREFSDRTAVDILALPVRRSAVVLAKFAVGIAWSAALTALMMLGGLLVGAALTLPGWSAAVVLAAVRDLAVCYALSVVLQTPVALAASAGRGYLPAVGLVLVVVVLAQALASVGAGGWFPWAVPALAVGAGGQDMGAVGAVGYALVAVTAVGGALATVWWWYRAE